MIFPYLLFAIALLQEARSSHLDVATDLADSQENEYFPSPFEKGVHSHKDFQPFKVLFITHGDMTDDDISALHDAFKFVNDKLGKILRGPVLSDVRLPCSDDGSSNLLCANVTVSGQYVIPCGTGSDEQEAPVPKVQMDSKEGYSMVVYTAIHGEGANDSNCEYFQKMNEEGPICRWYGPAIIGAACAVQEKRTTHARLIFCKPLNKFAIDQGELRMALLHETLHFVIPSLGFGSWKKRVTRTWYNASGAKDQQLFYLATSPSVQKAARRYFKCDTLEGAEVPCRLYPSGNHEPKWGHWSLRLYPDEIMAPHTSYEEAISALTLGAIEDQGMYEVDMSKAEDLPKWRQSINGCDLATKSCYELIKEARSRSDALHDIWPICDVEEISTRCSADGRRRLRCHQIEGYSCHSLHTVACHDHHPICGNATQQSHYFPTIGFAPGEDTICVTFASFPGLKSKLIKSEYYIPPCVQHECKRNDRVVLLKFKPPSNDACDYECTEDKANKKVEYIPSENCKKALDPGNHGGSITLICPDFAAICAAERVKVAMMTILAITVLTQFLIR